MSGETGIELNRRGFIGRSAMASAGAAMAFGFEEKALQAKEETTQPPNQPGEEFPCGKLGDYTISRVICGGNLISGFAHSRDLIYVSPLVKQYFTDEKVCETLALCEEQGINTAILRIDHHTHRILNKYWDEWGGRIQWIAQAKITEDDFQSDIRKAVDRGAIAAYIHGGVGDEFVEKGLTGQVGKALEFIRQNGLLCGLAAHNLATVKGYEDAGLDPEFYMKTINSKKYWSAGPMPRHDSVWSETPEETIAYMKSIQKPWIGYKVLGAGAIHPMEGFKYAFENGADFICVGMFDFQITEDVLIAKKILSEPMNRERPWLA